MKARFYGHQYSAAGRCARMGEMDALYDDPVLNYRQWDFAKPLGWVYADSDVSMQSNPSVGT